MNMEMRELGDQDLFYELDSHSNTTCAGNNCLVIEFTGKQVNDQPFSDTYKPISNVPVGTATTAYNCPDGAVVILVLHQVLCFQDKLKEILLPPTSLGTTML